LKPEKRLRFVHFYLIGYFLLVLGAGLALWDSGALARIPAVWLVSAVILAVALGLLLALTSTVPSSVRRE
jgi:lipopolysaccharide export LptBFGC system permease protein LptF